jgi:hypothetical protein
LHCLGPLSLPEIRSIMQGSGSGPLLISSLAGAELILKLKASSVESFSGGF